MAGCDVTKTKKKKGKGKNKKNVTVKCDSFFNFFESIDVSKAEDECSVKKADSDEEDEGDEKAEQMDMDFELGNTIKDDLVPLALEYYLGVVEQGEDSDDDMDDDSDDDDEKPKSKKKGSSQASLAGAQGAPGQNKEDCKQQ
jgi:hypothetical protein